MHNIARSIVILDEVQTLPRRLLAPLLGMMKELSERWQCDFVFSTATLPAFEHPPSQKDLRWMPGTIQEIVRQPERLRGKLKRAEIRWEIESPTDWRHIAERMLARRQALCIVNLRDHASDLYSAVTRLAADRVLDAAAVFHLSTRMCAAHRLRVIEAIRERLLAQQPCWVVSTQLVEAGVDLDFPLVMRALAPLDSIVQAAGRADREGKLTAELGRAAGEVVVFLPEDNRLPPHEYKEATGRTETLARDALKRGEAIQVDSGTALLAYYERYYGESCPEELGQRLQAMREIGKANNRGQFATLAGEFEMISNRTLDVFAPDDDEARAAIEELRGIGRLTAALRRRLQRHVIGLYPQEFQRAHGVLEELRPGGNIWIATSYDKKLGLISRPGPEHYVISGA